MTETNDPRVELAAALWPPRTGLTANQWQILLRPINPRRIAHRQQGGKQLSYLEAWEVKAHLTRIFGFGGWDGEVLTADLMFQDPAEIGREKKPGWQIGYKVVYRLRIKDQNGNVLATYTEAAIGQNSQTDVGEAHDTALKAAESDALKRCCINLGDQFGLSLYDDGSTSPVIKATLVNPDGVSTARVPLPEDKQEKLSHSVGHREPSEATETAQGADEPGPVPTPFDASPVPTVSDVHDSMREAIAATPRIETPGGGQV